MNHESDGSIQKIWESFRETHDEIYKNQLIEHYSHIVKFSAQKLHDKLTEKVGIDDLIKAGISGLTDAIEAYDPTRGVAFEPYCAPRIRTSIINFMKK